MERARVTAKRSADLLKRRRLSYAKTVFQRDAAVGKADLGFTNGEAALKAGEKVFVAERDSYHHLQRGLDLTRATSEAACHELGIGGGEEGPLQAGAAALVQPRTARLSFGACLAGPPSRATHGSPCRAVTGRCPLFSPQLPAVAPAPPPTNSLPSPQWSTLAGGGRAVATGG